MSASRDGSAVLVPSSTVIRDFGVLDSALTDIDSHIHCVGNG